MATRQSISDIVTHFARAGTTFNGTAQATALYARQLQDLGGVQLQATMRALGLSNAQQSEIRSLLMAASAVDGLSLSEIKNIETLGAEDIAKKLNIQTTDRLTQSMILNGIASGKLDASFVKLITDHYASATAAGVENTAMQAVNLTLKEYLALMAANPMAWISLLIAVVPLLVSGLEAIDNYIASLHPSLEQLKEDANGVKEEFKSLKNEFDENQKRIDELSELDMPPLAEQDELDRLKEENRLLELQLKTQEKLVEARKENVRLKAGEDIDLYLSDTWEASEADIMWGGTFTEATGKDRLTAAAQSYVKAKDAYDDAVVRAAKEAENGNLSGADAIKKDAEAYKRARDSYLETVNAELKRLRELRSEIADSTDEKDIDRVKAIDALIGTISSLIGIEDDADKAADDVMSSASNGADKATKRIKYMSDAVAGLAGNLQKITAHGSNVDLLNRPIVDVTNSNLATVRGWGMTDAQVGDHMTVATQTKNTPTGAIVVSPVTPEGKLLTQEELDKYITKVISKGKKLGNYAEFDDKGILLGVFEEMADQQSNIELANEFAEQLHEIHEEMLNLEDDPEALAELQARLVELVKYNPSLRNVAAQFKDLETGIGNLSAALKEFDEDGTVSLKTLAAIGDTAMGDCPSFEEFYATMLDGNATMEQAQAITNKLAGEYIDQAKQLGLLTEANREEIKATLDKLGVLNSEEVVEDRLARQYAETKNAEVDFTKATWADVEAKLQAEGATEKQINALKNLKLEQLNAITSTEDFANGNMATVTSAIAAAHAIGLESKALRDLEYFKAHPNTSGMKESMGDILSGVQADVAKAIAEVQAVVNTPIRIAVPKGSGGSSKSSSSKPTDKYFAEIDRFREYIKAVNDAQEEAERLDGILGRTGDLERQADLHGQLADQYDAECSALHALNEERRKAIQEGVDILNGAGLNAEYDPQANDLYIRDLERINELVYKDIPYGMRKFEYDSNGRLNFLGGNYDNQTEALNNYKKQLEGLASTISGWNDDAKDDSENWFTAFDSAFENRINSYEKRVKALENLITLNTNWQENAIAGRGYADVREYTDNIIDAYRKMQEQINAEAEAYRAKGYSDTSDEVSQLSDLWWQYQDEIENATKNAWDAVVSNANDALDEIQGVYDTLKQAAKEYSESGGYITIDTYQEVLALGPKYLSMLRDENGELKINEERIQAVIQARTEELGLEQAIAYVEELRAAKDDPKKLADLTRAIREQTSARWDLVKAELASLNLNEQDYKAALSNIEAIEALTVGAVEGINKSLSGTSELMDYVMDMVKQEVQDRIDAIHDMIDSYKEIVNLEKQRLQNAKKENDYQKGIASKLKDMAKLQARIDALGLAANSGDRKAVAERAALMDELADLQGELDEKQADHTLDAQTELLDSMASQYEDEKNNEIKELEDSIASKERLYQMALKRIESRYETLYNDLIRWNESAGSSLTYELESAWGAATKAAESYYGYVNGQSLKTTIDDYYRGNSNSADTGGTASGGITVAKKTSTSKLASTSVQTANSIANETDIRHWVSVMRENSRDWLSASKVERDRLERENKTIADKYLPDLGLTGLHRGDDGVWYLKDGRKLYDVYGGYHEGGFVGGKGEQLGLLKGGEFVLTEQMIANLTSYFNMLKKLGEGIIGAPALIRNAFTGDGFKMGSNTNISNITNTDNRPVEINMGDVIINGANGDTVKQHQKISREQVNEIARLVGLKQ